MLTYHNIGVYALKKNFFKRHEKSSVLSSFLGISDCMGQTSNAILSPNTIDVCLGARHSSFLIQGGLPTLSAGGGAASGQGAHSSSRLQQPRSHQVHQQRGRRCRRMQHQGPPEGIEEEDNP